MQVKRLRDRRFDKCNKLQRQNKIFHMDAKILYREIGKNQVMVKETPPKQSIEKFWEGIWREEKACNMSVSKDRENGERK